MAGNEVVIDVERKQVIKDSWKRSRTSSTIESRGLERLLDDFEVVIPRVGEQFRRGSKHCYTPKVVSIGPYHHGNSHLQAMEEFKERYLRDLLLRNKTPYEVCIQGVGEKAALARKRYQGKIRPYDDDGFVAMMVRDAGFIIELFMKESEGENPREICWIYPLIKRDMLLLENQLPFFVLLRLFDLTIGQKGTDNALDKLAINFFHSPVKKRATVGLPLPSVHHLLHLYQSQFCTDTYELEPPAISLIPCATILHSMGVKFSEASEDSLLTDVKFNIEGHTKELKVPHLYIAEETVVLFFNLIALEQHYFSLGTHFTSYAVFMNYMLSKAEDVEFLREKKIIEHRLGNHEEVVNSFAKMCAGAFVDRHGSSLSCLLVDIKSYSVSDEAVRLKTIWEAKPWYFIFYKDYVGIALVLLGGLGIWVFTLVQTLFSVLGYYHTS